MTARIAIPAEGIAAFCERWQVTEMALFGSVLRDDFGPDSDIDVLVSFDQAARHTLFDMVRMEEELKALFGREVDLVSRRGIERSSNQLRREAVLETAETILRLEKAPPLPVPLRNLSMEEGFGIVTPYTFTPSSPQSGWRGAGCSRRVEAGGDPLEGEALRTPQPVEALQRREDRFGARRLAMRFAALLPGWQRGHVLVPPVHVGP